MKHKKLLWGLFLLYLTVLLRITVFRSSFSFDHLFANGELNLIPFVHLLRIGSFRQFAYLFVGNLVWFMPFGILLSHLTKIKRSKIILYVFFFSLLIETMQFVFGTGVSELDDVILNTFGVYLGTNSYRISKNIFPFLQHCP